MAPAFGVRWDVDDAGGSESQLVVETARTSGPEAEAVKAWLHGYNERDVAAQAAIRDGSRR